ncbi:MAG: Hpt domain-containing protein [Myxococcota bacterium]
MARKAWQIEFDRLRAVYQRQLPEKLAGLESQLRAARAAGDRESLVVARREAHSLKGSSGSYGFSEVSRELQVIEDTLEDLLGSAQPDLIATWPLLVAHLARARAGLVAS